MNIKMLCLGAFALTAVAGSAMAAGENTSALDDPQKMAPFYTDSDMKTMKPAEDFKAAWMAMTDEDRNNITTVCADEAKNATAANTHPEFCSNVKALGGDN